MAMLHRVMVRSGEKTASYGINALRCDNFCHVFAALCHVTRCVVTIFAAAVRHVTRRVVTIFADAVRQFYTLRHFLDAPRLTQRVAPAERGFWLIFSVFWVFLEISKDKVIQELYNG